MIYPKGIFIESSDIGYRVIYERNPVSNWYTTLILAKVELARLSKVFEEVMDLNIYELTIKP